MTTTTLSWTARYDGFEAVTREGHTYRVTHWGGSYMALVRPAGIAREAASIQLGAGWRRECKAMAQAHYDTVAEPLDEWAAI